MATKRFLFWLKKLKFIPLLVLIIQCETKGRLSDPGSQKEEQVFVEQGSERPRLSDNSFVGKEAPKLGLILGGGGVLTYAHIGVLHELNKLKIPVYAIVGMEWGALVAATFSRKGRPHEVEWQLLKIPYNKFSKKGIFSASKEPVSIRDFDKFLKKIFSTSSLKESKVPFACPFVDLKTAKSRMVSSGRFANAVKKCWPYPPQFKMERNAANPLAVKEAANFLRKRGAELIIYIDVISKNLLQTAKQRVRAPVANLIWAQNKSISKQLKRLGVDEVLALPLSGSHLTAYDSMRLMVRAGQMKSSPELKKIAKKYGY